MALGLVIAGLVLMAGVAAIVLLEIRHRRERRDALRWRRVEKRLPAIERLEALGAVVGGIGHEFNNIVFVIMGYADMALDGLDPESPAREDIQKILVAGERAKRLTAQILDLSRGGGGEPRRLRLAPLVKEAVKLLEPGAPEGIEIVHRVDDGELEVTARPVDLYRILLHLCREAIEAMQPGGGKLNIELHPGEAGQEDGSLPAAVAPERYLSLRVCVCSPRLEGGGKCRVFESLSAVRAIARELGGEAVGGEAAEGEAAVEIQLPAAPHGGGQDESALIS